MPNQKKQNSFQYQIFDSPDELEEPDKSLLQKAKDACGDAYAPYSLFMVGAAALLDNGQVLKGSNQENASSPAGLCAERVLLSAISSMYPKYSINTIAISYNNKKTNNSNKPVAPCGICRQSLLEYQLQQKHPIRMILSGMKGQIIVIEDIAALLPFSFSSTDMA